jgi:poly-gamma-glutamate system protein
MFKPSLKSTWTLLVLAICAYGLYLWAENSRVEHRQAWYEEKIEAAELMSHWMDMLRDAKAPDAAFVDEVNDPARTMLIGQKHTLITSTEGNHQAKLATLNPNVAAMMIQMYHEAGLDKGDRIAMGVTGSFPGLNLAAYAAARVMELDPVIITSVSSSWYGANDPDFTWLDMEKVLYDSGEITFHSRAASIGGADDRGQSLPPEGRELIRESIHRAGIEFLNPGNVEEAVRIRTQIFTDEVRESLRGYSAYINIGGGVASIGHPENAKLLPVGYARHLDARNYPARGVIHYFSDNGVPLINFKYVSRRFSSMLKSYGLPWRPGQDIETGRGEIFVSERYDLRIVGLAVFIMTILVAVVIRFDLKLQQLGSGNGSLDDMH